MIMAADKQDKVLNFSSKREQSGTCSSSAEHEKNQGKNFLNVPTLRFPEFSGEWEKTKLSEVCHIATGNKNTQDKDDNGQYPFYVRSQHIEHINSWTYDGEAILTAGDGVGVGKVFHYSKGKIGVHQRVYILNDFKCDGKFLFYYFSGHFYDRVKRMSAKNSVDSVRMEMIANMNFIYPRRGEQTKIGHLFSLLDERIETQIRIIEELKLFRDTLMFKLLSPRKNWEHVCIHDVAMVVGGGTPDTNVKEYWDGNIQWFTPSEIGKEKYVIASERTISQAGLDNSSAKLLPANTILLSTRATIGECSIAKKECCTNQGFQSLVATTVTPEFLYYLIQTKKRDLLSKASGSTFSEISANEVRKIHICIPTTAKEQKAIVQPLSAYDEKIETECKILQLYKRQKQFLLSQMFI